MSGYEIKDVIGRTLGHFWTEGYGQIYPTLKHLAEAGLATSRVEQTAGKPDRHVYSLTDAGWDELGRWLAEPVEGERSGRNELLLKLFFGRHAPSGTNLTHLRRHRELMATQIAHFEAIAVELEAENSPDQPYWLITIAHGLHVSRASLAWCDHTIALLSELEGRSP